MLRAFLLALALLSGCGGPGTIRYVNEQCLIDNQPATLKQVEARQAEVSQRIINRAPLFILLTVLVVVLAGMSHMEKLVLLFSARRANGKKFGERLQAALERYRSRPVRYFTIVIGTLILLLAAGGCYIYLDADKRASERALGMLEFCHLALRTRDAQGVLTEERNNLQAIQSTAGDIRALVDKLPPEEQHKAHQIVATLNAALAQQGKLVGDYLTRTEQTSALLNQHTQALERGLSSVEAGVLGLKALPGGLHDLEMAVQKLDGRMGGYGDKLDAQSKTIANEEKALADAEGQLGKLASQDTELAALKTQVSALAARPAPTCPPVTCPPVTCPQVTCPACVCQGAHEPHDAHETEEPRSPREKHDAPPPRESDAARKDGGAADHLAPTAVATHK